MAVRDDDFRALMGSFASSVTVVTTLDADGTPHALTATAFTSVSLDPPLCLVCVDRTARAHGPMRVGRKFAVNVLAAGQRHWSVRFSQLEGDRFAGIEWRPGPRTGCPLLPGTLARAECEVADICHGGDHDIFIGRVLSAESDAGAPLVYWRGAYSRLASLDDDG